MIINLKVKKDCLIRSIIIEKDVRMGILLVVSICRNFVSAEKSLGEGSVP